MSARIGDEVIVINGTIELSSNTSSLIFKRARVDRKLKAPQVQKWVATVRAVLPAFREETERLALDSIRALHDVKSLIGSILRTAEDWAWEQPGQNFDEKLESGSEHLRKILHSCRILESLLQMTDIIANPESAKFGQRTATAVHGGLFMLQKIFEAKAATRNVALLMKGSSYNRPPLYPSFIIVPLVLIDNAIKHSEQMTEIHIATRDSLNGGVMVDISSYGEVVPVEERESIFLRGIRGSNARALGSGLGLYIAQLVAAVNGFQIRYDARNKQGTRGFNHFHFAINANESPQSQKG